MKIDDLVERLGGLDSLLNADRQSHGQRQLLCLTKVILAAKRIILLDKGSSNVDEQSDRLIR